ncbi:unnamed protein product [Heterotrigona itama]|uniref:Uncharacterized protein n=1 Tax=Heterotrigona itama TaxID=395501 RepID=A0A6V7HFL6_9HYME|nr:unnamed protein product [Heterotrigona itama]
MSIRVSGVYLVPSPAANNEPGNEKPSNNLSIVDNSLQQQQQQQHHHHHHHHHHHAAKTVTIVAGPQRSNSLDYLNFEEKRQIIASSLSLSDFLAHGPAAAAAAAKEVAANTVIATDLFKREIKREAEHSAKSEIQAVRSRQQHSSNTLERSRSKERIFPWQFSCIESKVTETLVYSAH